MSFRMALACAVVLFTMAPAVAAEQSPDASAPRAGIREACGADVKALCDGVQPGGGKILRCLKEHQAQVSTGCKQAAAAMRAARKGED